MIALIRCAYLHHNDRAPRRATLLKPNLLTKFNWRVKLEQDLYLSLTIGYHRCLSGWHGHWQTKSTVYFLSPMNWPSLTTASTEGSVMMSPASSSTVAATIDTVGRGPKRVDWPAVVSLTH